MIAHILKAMIVRTTLGCPDAARVYIWCFLFLALLLSGLRLNAATEVLECVETQEFNTGINISQDNILEKDSVRVYFKGGESFYDPNFGNNKAVLSAYIDRIRKLNCEGLLDNIVVEGYVSPDGSVSINERLAVQRSDILADIIVREAGVDRSKIKTVPVGINWDELRRLIESRQDVPSRQALLDIIDNTPVWVYNERGKIVDGRKKRLMDLRGGRPYRWLYANLFPEMRNAVAISLNNKKMPVPVVESELADSVKVIEGIPIDTICHTVEEEIITSTDVKVIEYEPLHALALKTNLLYYAALLPNLELEWYVNDKWSVGLEGDFAWWGKYSKDRSYRLAIVSPEVRYRFLRGPLRRGMFVGATVGYGWYDFLKNSSGYLGGGVMSGITCGYQWPVSRNLSLEALLGVGYVYTKFKEYRPYEGHHVYMRTKEINYFGPIKLKFSIVWRFFDINKSRQSIIGR